jgi:hypothetical protein
MPRESWNGRCCRQENPVKDDGGHKRQGYQTRTRAEAIASPARFSLSPSCRGPSGPSRHRSAKTPGRRPGPGMLLASSRKLLLCHESRFEYPVLGVQIQRKRQPRPQEPYGSTQTGLARGGCMGVLNPEKKRGDYRTKRFSMAPIRTQIYGNLEGGTYRVHGDKALGVIQATEIVTQL